MDKPTRWSKLIKSLRFDHIPFNLIRRAKIVTKNKVEYIGSTYDDFQNIIQTINKSLDSDLIETMNIETKDRKIKKEAQNYVDRLFSKYFS